MNQIRRCSRPGCGRPAVATLTYAYAESTAVIGPLAATPDPHSWDLCERHSEKITAPVGWEVVRVGEISIGDDEDLMALASAVREGGRVTTGLVDDDAEPGDPIDQSTPFTDSADPDRSNHPVHRIPRVYEEKQQRRAHLSVVPDDDTERAATTSVNGSRHVISDEPSADHFEEGDKGDNGEKGGAHRADSRAHDIESTSRIAANDSSSASQPRGQHYSQQPQPQEPGDIVDTLNDLDDSEVTDFESLWPADSEDNRTE